MKQIITFRFLRNAVSKRCTTWDGWGEPELSMELQRVVVVVLMVVAALVIPSVVVALVVESLGVTRSMVAGVLWK